MPCMIQAIIHIARTAFWWIFGLQRASFYEKTDFLRISDVTLGYNFPQQWLRRTFIKRLNLYMNIKNLATITGWTGMDPEFLNDQLAAPPVRSFTFGLKLDI